MQKKPWRDYIRWVGLLPTPVVVHVATLGPVGIRMKAPGTWGSVAGVLLYTLFFAGMPLLGQVLLLAALSYLAVAFCDEAEQRLGQRDPGSIILDETVAMPLCLMGLQPHFAAWREAGLAWVLLLAAFGLFRLFDIWKPLGIRRLQNLPGGIGVVADDLAAALATVISLQLLIPLVLLA